MDINVTFPGGKKVNAEVNGYIIATDQPQKVGGGGSAASPFDYFLSSIATCAGIYALEFVAQRNLPVEGLKLRAEFIKDPEKKMIGKVIFHVETPPGFPEKYKDALIKSINLCTVKKHLHDPPGFETIVNIRN